MKIFKKGQDLQTYLSEESKKGVSIAFVPTMGALHAGHRSLIEKAKGNKALVVCSIFINPTQFNNKNDFEKYPVAEEADTLMLINAGCDVLFMPGVDEMYPQGFEKSTSYDFGYLDTILEGAHRPGHFKGVGQIVARLLDMVKPKFLYLGQKDFQQCMVIKKLVEMLGKQNDIDIIICPTIREADGLAMSSRNMRLTEPQRTLSSAIYQCLISIQAKKETDNFQVVQQQCIDLLTEKGFEPEYVALAQANDLKLLDNYITNQPMVALIAAKIGDVRLIDNMMM